MSIGTLAALLLLIQNWILLFVQANQLTKLLVRNLWIDPSELPENEAGYPPALAVIQLAAALHVSTDQILGVEETPADPLADDPNLRRLWKRFQKIASLPEKTNEPSSGSSIPSRRSCTQGDWHLSRADSLSGIGQENRCWEMTGPAHKGVRHPFWPLVLSQLGV